MGRFVDSVLAFFGGFMSGLPGASAIRDPYDFEVEALIHKMLRHQSKRLVVNPSDLGRIIRRAQTENRFLYSAGGLYLFMDWELRAHESVPVGEVWTEEVTSELLEMQGELPLPHLEPLVIPKFKYQPPSPAQTPPPPSSGVFDGGFIEGLIVGEILG
jgi:hypothetical protein